MQLALLGFVGSLALTAQSVSFLPPKRIQVGPQCCSLLAGDFNRDGKADIAVAHFVTSLTVLLGDGKGGFTRVETALTNGTVIVGLVATADINSDGITDILAMARIPTVDPLAFVTIALIGRGDGTFQTPVVLGPDLVKAVADFNGDGKPDLLVWPGPIDQSGGLGFGVRFGNGDGTFQPTGPSNPFSIASFYRWAVAADFNHDGKADIAQTSWHRFPWAVVLMGKGDGTFGDSQLFSLSSQATGARRLAVGDFNRDGNPDLAVLSPAYTGYVTNQDETSIEILLGRGDGTFKTSADYRASLGESDVENPIAVADFNGDGLPDVAEGFTVLLGNGDGSLQSPVVFGELYRPVVTGLRDELPYSASMLAVADFNGDGKADMIGSVGDGTQLVVLLSSPADVDGSASAVTSATYTSPVAPGSIATVFGNGFTDGTATASQAPLPTVLRNTRVRVVDKLGVERLAGLIYMSPSQINFVLPPGTAEGLAIVNVDNGKLAAGARSTRVRTIAPAFFTLDGTGHGMPAATAVRVLADGTQTPVPLVQCSSAGTCSPLAIDLNAGGTVYLSLYGTGFDSVSRTGTGCDWFGITVLVTYSGPQGQYPGLDQVNLQLPKTLKSGPVDISCSFGNLIESGYANIVTIQIK